MQPKDRKTREGRRAVFRVRAIGVKPLSYQWSRNGNLIENSNSKKLLLRQVTATTNGDKFKVTVTDALGREVTSSEVELQVK